MVNMWSNVGMTKCKYVYIYMLFCHIPQSKWFLVFVRLVEVIQLQSAQKTTNWGPLGTYFPLGSRAGEVGENLPSHRWQKGIPHSEQRVMPMEASARGDVKGGWKHLQPECGNQLLNLSEAVGHHGNSSRPWLAFSNPAVPKEELCQSLDDTRTHTLETEALCNGTKVLRLQMCRNCETWHMKRSNLGTFRSQIFSYVDYSPSLSVNPQLPHHAPDPLLRLKQLGYVRPTLTTLPCLLR